MFKKTSKKVSALVLSLALLCTSVLAIVPAEEVKAAASPASVTLSYTVHYDDAFKDVQIYKTVSGDAADNLGYSDSTDSSSVVSVFDVMVEAHKDIFGAAFTANPTAYLSESGGWLSNAFGKGGVAVGYTVNTVTASGLTDIVNSYDVVDMFYYGDTSLYSDSYTYFKDYSISGSQVSGKLMRRGYDASWNTVTEEATGVSLGWYNSDTKTITKINGLTTASDGTFTATAPSSNGSYYLTVYDSTIGTSPVARTLLLDYNVASYITASAKSDAFAKDTLAKTGKYTADNTDPEYEFEWAILGLSRSGYSLSNNFCSDYYNDVANTLKNKSGVLHTSSSNYSNYARTIIGLSAAGYDAKNVGGYNLVSKVDDYSAVKAQGINGEAYALMALDTKNYASTSRKKYINDLLSAQTSQGGWGYYAGTNDADMTGIVIAALAPYYKTNSEVKSAVDKGLTYLSKIQNADGTYSSFGAKNSSSSAMVVTALSVLGINPDTDARFIKNGVSALDAMLSYAVSTGGFGYGDNSYVSDYNSVQCYYALAAYYRMINGQASLFDMTTSGISESVGLPTTVSDPSGVLPKGCVMTTSKITSGNIFDKVSNLVKKTISSSIRMTVYEFDLSDLNGQAIHQLDGKVSVTIDAPFTPAKGKTIVVYRLDGDKLVKCDTTLENGKVSFLTDHFSTYVFVEEDVLATTTAPKTGDNFYLYMILIMSALGLGIVMVRKSLDR